MGKTNKRCKKTHKMTKIRLMKRQFVIFLKDQLLSVISRLKLVEQIVPWQELRTNLLSAKFKKSFVKKIQKLRFVIPVMNLILRTQ